MREIEFRAFHRLMGEYIKPEQWLLYGAKIHNGVISSENHVVEQYTGLKDKNGKKIFEGDIICFDDNGYYERRFIDKIVFKNGTFRFMRYKFWKDGVHDWFSLENVWAEDIEVIGNIHENPELMENADD